MLYVIIFVEESGLIIQKVIQVVTRKTGGMLLEIHTLLLIIQEVLVSQKGIRDFIV